MVILVEICKNLSQAPTYSHSHTHACLYAYACRGPGKAGKSACVCERELYCNSQRQCVLVCVYASTADRRVGREQFALAQFRIQDEQPLEGRSKNNVRFIFLLFLRRQRGSTSPGTAYPTHIPYISTCNFTHTHNGGEEQQQP